MNIPNDFDIEYENTRSYIKKDIYRASWHKDNYYPLRSLIALSKVLEYAKKLCDTDYRGNPPTEHYIGKKIIKMIGDETDD